MLAQNSKNIIWHHHFVYQRKLSEKGARSPQMQALVRCPLDGRGQDGLMSQADPA